MKIKDIIPPDELISKLPFGVKEITSCTSKYEDATENSLLFLLPGIKYDSYKFIPNFLKSPAYAIVTEDKTKFPKTRKIIIEVKNSRRAFSYAMSNLFKIDYSSLKFIGITGTNGKTTTATLIKEIFERNEKKCGFIGTGKIDCMGNNLMPKYYSMTCPDPDILYPSIKKMQDAGCEYIIMEASSHALELHKTDPIKFDIGIFTGLSHEHLEFHGNMGKYLSAKEKLIKNSKSAIINFDDKYGRRLFEKYKNKALALGRFIKKDIFISDIQNHGFDGSCYKYDKDNLSTDINLSLPGIHNIYNSAFAFACANLCGISAKDIKNALEKCKKIEGRCECIKSDITVVIDYAHTPKAFDNLLKTVNSNKKQEQNVSIVFGCGGERDPWKRPLMAESAERYANKIIITNDNPRSEPEKNIILDIIKGFKKKSYACICDREMAIRYAIKSAKDSDIVVIAGKGHEKYILDKDGYRDFDERAIIENALELRKCRK